MRHVHIVGDGIAALCCAHLLSGAGLRVSIDRVARPRVPAILLGDQALGLIRDVFARPDLFADRARIDRRIVRWDRPEASVIPHGAVAVPEALLIAELGRGLDIAAAAAPDFTIRTAASAIGGQRRFGARHGTAIAARLRDPSDATACRIEAVAAGWLFLVPDGSGAAWLLGVGAPIVRLLGDSRIIAPHIAWDVAEAPAFDTCPRLADAIIGRDWLACGTAAIGFDPICGDGAAQAIRAAILAAAVIVAIMQGGDAGALLGHYEAILIATMRRHVALSLDFYATGGSGMWWQAQAEALRQGHAHCTARLATMPEPRFLLDGFRLVPREAAA